MSKATVQLTVNNLKEMKMGYEQSNFYLTFDTFSDEYLISPCKNILFDGAPFEVEKIGQIRKIEVWNYDTRRRVGTMFVSEQGKGKNFEYAFKKHNIKLVLAWPQDDAVAEGEAPNRSEKSDSEESRSTYHNLSSEEEL